MQGQKQRGEGCQGNNIQRILLDEQHVLLWNETSSGWPKEEKVLAFSRNNTIDGGAAHDLTAFKRECMPHLNGKTILGDKIYSDSTFFNDACSTKMFTPCKKVKGEAEIITQREKATRDLFSTAVSKVRQPIESFFNWLNEKTEIQRASKVRATKGVLVHVFWKVGDCSTCICKVIKFESVANY